MSKSRSQLINQFQGTDPATYNSQFGEAVGRFRLRAAITFETATFTLGTIPAGSTILERRIIRTAPWDAPPDVAEIGKSGDTDWLATTAQANLDGAIPEGEAGGVEAVSSQKYVTTDTDIIVTLDHGAATAGAGYVEVEYS
jgi:hypothetical protein